MKRLITNPDLSDYNELELFEIESKMRAAVGYLVKPIADQLLADRNEFVNDKLDILRLKEQMQNVEGILFETDENGRMKIFDRMFDAIKEVDTRSITEA